jgi:hypothetical protein
MAQEFVLLQINFILKELGHVRAIDIPAVSWVPNILGIKQRCFLPEMLNSASLDTYSNCSYILVMAPMKAGHSILELA